MKLEPKPIPGYEDRYYLDPSRMAVVSNKTGKPICVHEDSNGYAEVRLHKDNNTSYRRVHRLFAEAYIPNPDDLPQINHKDEDKMNYSLDNLEWCTPKYNVNYGTGKERRMISYRKTKPYIEKPPKQAVTQPIKTIAIDSNGNEYCFSSRGEASRELGVKQSKINEILAGKKKTTHGYSFRNA